ncbi:MAG: hypothetical protein ACK53V_23190, partial [Planctomycetota bacterium]
GRVEPDSRRGSRPGSVVEPFGRACFLPGSVVGWESPRRGSVPLAGRLSEARFGGTPLPGKVPLAFAWVGSVVPPGRSATGLLEPVKEVFAGLGRVALG